MERQLLFEKITDVLHSYLDNPCHSCTWSNKELQCDLTPDCDWICRDDRIDDMAKEIIGLMTYK